MMDIQDAILIPGCPPLLEELAEGLEKAGISVNPMMLDNFDKGHAYFMKKYDGKPEFSDDFYHLGG